MAKKIFGKILVALGLVALTVHPTSTFAQQTSDTSSGVSVFMEDFNDVSDAGIPDGWLKDGLWGVVYAGESFNKVLYGDYLNIPYLGNQDGVQIISPTIDLSGATSATVSFITRCDTEYASGRDYMKLRASVNGSNFEDIHTWNEVTIDSDTDPSGRVVKTFSNIEIPSHLLSENSKIAFSWTTNGDDNDYDGCFIDDVEVKRDGTDTNPGTIPDDTDDDDDSTATTTPDDNDDDNGTTTPTGDNDDDNENGTTTPTDDNDDNTGGDTDTVQSISACSTLSEQGTTYRLTQSVVTDGTCFTITADNITLDGGGFEVTGDSGSGDYGVFAENRSNVLIKNISFNEFDLGTRFVATNNSTLDDILWNTNTYGFVLHEGENISVKNSRAENNQVAGIYLKDAEGSSVEDNQAVNNEVGINLDSSENNTIDGNTVQDNDRGILLLESHDNTITSNEALNNFFGIVAELTSSRNIIENNTVTNNQVGVALGGGENTVRGLQINGSQSKGIQFFEADSINNVIENTVITNTNPTGFDISFDEAGPNSSAAGVNGTVFRNTLIGKYSIVSPGGTLTVANNNGEVQFIDPVEGSGESLSNQIIIEENKISIGDEFNKHATIIFKNVSLSNPTLSINGENCVECTLSSNTSSGISFSVNGAGTYEIDGITISDGDNDDDDDNGNGTTTPTDDDDDNGSSTTTPTGNNDDGTGTTTPDDSNDDDTGNGTTTSNGNDDDDDDTATTTPDGNDDDDDDNNNGTTTPTDDSDDDDTATTTPDGNDDDDDGTATTTPTDNDDDDNDNNNGTTTPTDDSDDDNGTTTPTDNDDDDTGTPTDGNDQDDGRVSRKNRNIVRVNRSGGQVAGATIDLDLNNDGRVDIYDLNIVMRDWGKSQVDADLDRDGRVSILDAGLMIGNWSN